MTYQRREEPLLENERAVEQLIKDNSPLTGIEKALQQGHKIHGFRSGGGLRVVSIKLGDVLKGYGEHPSVDHALRHADEDILAGVRDYHAVYGKKYPHYLTGSSDVTSPLDGWLLRGNTFDTYVRNKEVVSQLQGYSQTETPDYVMKQVNKTGKPVRWKNRGYLYETEAFRFPNGDFGHSTSVISDLKKGMDPWMYIIIDVLPRPKGRGFL